MKKALAKRLRVPDEVANEILKEEGGGLLQRLFNQAVEDLRRLSPEEEGTLTRSRSRP